MRPDLGDPSAAAGPADDERDPATGQRPGRGDRAHEHLAVRAARPNSCRFAVTVIQTTRFAGGTGIFAGASGDGTGQVDGTGMAQRNPDGSCNLDLEPAHERDAVSGSGTLTF